MNLESDVLCCKLPWFTSAWSSSRPCCRPSRPPTKFGLSSSISFCWPHADPAEKFNWRLKMAGKMLNCCESGLAGLNPKLDGAPEEVPELPPPPPPFPALPSAPQLDLKSNLPLLWYPPTDDLFTWRVRSDGRYSLIHVYTTIARKITRAPSQSALLFFTWLFYLQCQKLLPENTTKYPDNSHFKVTRSNTNCISTSTWRIIEFIYVVLNNLFNSFLIIPFMNDPNSI